MPTDSIPPTDSPAGDDSARRLAADLFNGTWRLLDKPTRSADENDSMIHMAHASRHHWAGVGTPVNLVRGEWLCSRVYATLDRAEPALYHARRAIELCQRNDIGGFDLGASHEAMARALAVAGEHDRARESITHALAAADGATDDDRALLLSDLESIPGQQRFW